MWPVITQLQGIKPFGMSIMSPKAFVHVKQMLSLQGTTPPTYGEKTASLEESAVTCTCTEECPELHRGGGHGRCTFGDLLITGLVIRLARVLGI